MAAAIRQSNALGRRGCGARPDRGTGEGGGDAQTRTDPPRCPLFAPPRAPHPRGGTSEGSGTGVGAGASSCVLPGPHTHSPPQARARTHTHTHPPSSCLGIPPPFREKWGGKMGRRTRQGRGGGGAGGRGVRKQRGWGTGRGLREIRKGGTRTQKKEREHRAAHESPVTLSLDKGAKHAGVGGGNARKRGAREGRERERNDSRSLSILAPPSHRSAPPPPPHFFSDTTHAEEEEKKGSVKSQQRARRRAVGAVFRPW